MNANGRKKTLCLFLLVCATCGTLCGQGIPPSANSKQDGSADGHRTDGSPADVLPPDEWRRVDAAVDRALTFLAAQQQPDGSFPTLPQGQPAVTSLCVLAFMAHGHNPSDDPYGQRLARATDYIVSCQKDNGLIVAAIARGNQDFAQYLLRFRRTGCVRSCHFIFGACRNLRNEPSVELRANSQRD